MAVPQRQTRRQFVKSFCLLTASSKFLGDRWLGTVLAEVRPLSEPATAVLPLNIEDFPALLQDYGSVRLGTNPPIDDRPSGPFYPIIINRSPGKKFFALSSECSHEGCVVPPFDATEKHMECPCHGSRYGIDGSVLRGPAGFALLQYKTQFDGLSKLTIELPGMEFSILATKVDPQPKSRLRLDFFALTDVEYEVRFHRSLSSGWTLVGFSISPDGAADQMSLISQGGDTSLYVDRVSETGFYAIAMRFDEV